MSLTGEFDLVERLRRRFVQVGDDAAVVDPPAGPLLLAADAVVAGIHVDLDLVGLGDVGWKAVIANVSDIAAMGGRPLHLLITIAAPAGTSIEDLIDGVAEAASAYDCQVVGGDLSCIVGPLVVSVAITGTVDGGGSPVGRGGARPGDAIFVTGSLGASAAGLRLLRAGRGRGVDARGPVAAHLRPSAQPRAGQAARQGGASAMIDVSDGLASDLGHIADDSEVGVQLEQVPVAEGATLDEALHGGEDYALVFTAPDPSRSRASFEDAHLVSPIEIGVCVNDRGQRLLRGEPLAPGGWEHQWR